MKLSELLSSIRDDIKDAELNGKSEISTQRILEYIRQRSEEVREIENSEDQNEKDKKAREEAFKKQVDHWRSVCATSQKNAHQYNTIAFMGGYATAITIWFKAYDIMEIEFRIISILLIGFSLMMFIFYEVGSQILKGKILKKQSLMFQCKPEDFEVKLEEAKEEEELLEIGEIPTYWIFVTLILLSGFLGGGTLLVGLGRVLLNT